MAVPTPSTEEHAVVPGRAVPEGARHTGPGPDDEFLVALAKNGRTDAYDQLVRRYRRFVRVKSSSYFLLGGDADDLMQEGMLGLFKAIRDYRPERESSLLTIEGTFLGTPEYASPEQVEGKKLDHRTDLYSLGVTYYQLLSGTLPFLGESPMEIAIKRTKEEPRPLENAFPGADPRSCSIVKKLLRVGVRASATRARRI